jgi:hypothetical protein
MNLRPVSAKERKRDRLGDAIRYELDLDHMGAAVGRTTATVYLGPSQVVKLWDVLRVGRTEGELMSEQLWGDLMATVERLHGEYGDLSEGDGPDDGSLEAELVAWGEARGRAQGVALALAILTNPTSPDVDAVREESVERWEAQMGESAG